MARNTTRTPGPGLPRHRRTAGDFVKAFLAFVALAALLVGVPGALAHFVGWPLPHSMPSADVFQREITADVFIKALTALVWLAWAQFAACVLVEVKAEVSGVGMPPRVPGAGASQLLARQLVAAVLLVGATAASLTPGLSQLGHTLDGGNHHPAVAAAERTPGGGQEQQAGDRADGAPGAAADRARPAPADSTAEELHRGTKFYRVHPPEGRHHDSLWEIAERHLDDGRRYKEIYELNKDRVQPDGEKLTEASLIRPGWIMEMPADAHGGELVEMPDEAPRVPEQVRQEIRDYDRTGPHAEDRQTGDQQPGRQDQQPGSEHQQPGHHQPGHQHQQPAQDINADRPDQPLEAPILPAEPAQGASRDTAQGASAAAPAAGSESFGVGEALVAAPLLAAGLLAALGRRRRTSLWQAAATVAGHRRAGTVPAGDPANARDALLVGADPEAVRDLDRGLRSLSAALSADSRELPAVYAAWLTGTELQLQLAQPSGEPPAPWRQGSGPLLWSVPRSAIRLPADSANTANTGSTGNTADTAAPYPGLVSLGTDGASRLLLNLEAVPGLVALTGSAADRAAVLASVAAELATNGWSDRLTLTLVGFGQDFRALAPARIRRLDDIDALVDTMRVETRQRRAALSTAGHDSVLTGRAGRAQHAQWAPHLVIVAAEPDEAGAAALAELAAGSDRLGIGYLVGTGGAGLPGAAWELEITPAGRLLAPLLGLELDAQRLPQSQVEAVVELFSAADADRGPEHDPDPADSPFLVDITEAGRPAVYARLVGSYEVMGPAAPEDERSPLLHEALAMLLLHREGVHPRVLASGLWPRGVTTEVRDALVARLRDWLGTEPDGTHRLRTDAAGRLTLAPSVVSDLDVLRTLHHEATEGKGAGRPAVRERLLADALGLARGPLLADRPAGRYGWLEHEIIDAQLPLLVADVALALSGHRMEAGRPEAAAEAVNAALVTAPADERLWNQLLRAVHATGDVALLAETASSLVARNAALGGAARGLPPRTEALLDELLPAWRGAQAN
ncbi:BTAD domain-containing putative transcriptional regulator [Streptomyces nondiastaticus]|uniref:BTAD domain-containing putative transcriptional regulator n=1 Tax=Streptomyces nondiastaticus TaxID=3154512 RepID=A0ABW6U752_9ACTN